MKGTKIDFDNRGEAAGLDGYQIKSALKFDYSVGLFY